MRKAVTQESPKYSQSGAISTPTSQTARAGRKVTEATTEEAASQRPRR